MVTLYTHLPEAVLRDLAGKSFPEGYVLSSALDWMVEDAIDQAYAENEPHAVIQVEVSREALEIDREDLWLAIAEDLEVDPDEVSEEDLPKTFEKALELVESAVLVDPVSTDQATVLGVPFEVREEDLTPKELKDEIWFRFPHLPVPLKDLKQRFWPGIFRKIFFSRKRSVLGRSASARLGAVEGWVVTHDGETLKTGFTSDFEAVDWLHRQHGFSVDRAVRHEGYDIVLVRDGKVQWSYKRDVTRKSG
jgi:hypothetical protein